MIGNSYFVFVSPFSLEFHILFKTQLCFARKLVNSLFLYVSALYNTVVYCNCMHWTERQTLTTVSWVYNVYSRKNIQPPGSPVSNSGYDSSCIPWHCDTVTPVSPHVPAPGAPLLLSGLWWRLAGLRQPRHGAAQRGVDRQHAGHRPRRHLGVVEVLLTWNKMSV